MMFQFDNINQLNKINEEMVRARKGFRENINERSH